MDLSDARVGVIGGSGLYAMPGLEGLEERSLETPFGRPSDALRLGRLRGMEVVFLARHGRHHHLMPKEVPYAANVWAMRSLGVRWLISVSAVGSLKEHLRPRDMVVPDQFIDRTHQRPQSFFGDGCVAHVSLADPTCPILNELLAMLPRKRSHPGIISIAAAPTCAWKVLPSPPALKAGFTAAGDVP